MKKSLYVFLSSLLGTMLFLLLHRLFMYFYYKISIVNPGMFFGKLTYLDILALDLFTLLLALLLGLWYGIALGLKWYELVYESRAYKGVADNFVSKFSLKKNFDYDLKTKINLVAKELKQDVLAMENLVKSVKPSIKTSVPIKRRVVRKKTIFK